MIQDASVGASDIAPRQLIDLLGLQPHPEGGHFIQTWQAPSDGARSSGTAIYFLLQEGEVSHWHRVDSAEVWHHYAGAPLALDTWVEGSEVTRRHLGTDILAGERPQLIVAPGEWQTARSVGAWTLAGCTVSPGFEFGHFELAAPDWEPSTSGLSR